MIRMLLLLLLITGPGFYPALAQSESEPNEPEVSTEEQESSPDSDQQTGSEGPVSENFRPSEDISEDLSVSFPVDI